MNEVIDRATENIEVEINPNRRSIPALSIDAQLLYERLIQVKPGKIIIYNELSKILGRSVQSSNGRGLLQSARKKARRENKIVFGVHRGFGLERLDDEGIIATTQQALTGVNNKARNALKTMSCIHDYDNLPSEAQVKHNTNYSILGMLYSCTKGAKIKKLENTITKECKKLSLTKTLEFFAGN